MNKQDLKKILAGISVASLLTGAGIGCTSQSQQSAPASKETQKAAPAQLQDTKAPGTAVPAPGS
jgi:radical SAM modification target selenobiotic family peptide